jgi:hypothetical protein
MKQKVNIAILAFVTAVIGLVAPVGAQAEPQFAPSISPATVDGTALSRTVFRFNGNAWECLATGFKGESTGLSSSLTVSPSFGECRWNYPPVAPSVWSTVQVAMNGCDFNLHSLKRLASHEYSSLLDLKCPAGQQVVIDLNSWQGPICKLTVPPQANKSSVRLVNKTVTPADVEAIFAVNGLKYTQDLTTPFPTCPVKVGTYEFLEFQHVATLTTTYEPGKQTGFQVIGE